MLFTKHACDVRVLPSPCLAYRPSLHITRYSFRVIIEGIASWLLYFILYFTIVRAWSIIENCLMTFLCLTAATLAATTLWARDWDTTVGVC